MISKNPSSTWERGFFCLNTPTENLSLPPHSYKSESEAREYMEQAQHKVYFPGLNGLRFFAALAVILTHVELLKAQADIPNRWSSPLFFNLGGLGVYFFFVLSGFLITFLLLSEKQFTGQISIKDFYIRRILRIWPLYYVVILLGFFVFPYLGILKIPYFSSIPLNGPVANLLFYLFMMPNLAFAFFGPVPLIGQAWSIGVEEQFYLFWPLLIKFSRNILRTIILVAGVIVLIKAVILLLWFRHPGNPVFLHFKSFVAMSKIESMAIGAVGAYLLFNKKDHLLRLIFLPLTQIVAFATIPVLIYFTPDRIQDGIHLVYSAAFLVIILNVSANSASILKLENRLFNFLGRISYGLYMYHMVAVILALKLYRLLGDKDPDSVSANVFYYSFTILLTIAIAWLSNQYFEGWFLRKKRKYSRIETT
jgi:peptidoglycan/LPS O-acetylase OafA/YrhL